MNLLSQTGASSITPSEIAAKIFEDEDDDIDDKHDDTNKICFNVPSHVDNDGNKNSCNNNNKNNNKINDDITEKDIDDESNESVVVSTASLQFLINHSRYVVYV